MKITHHQADQVLHPHSDVHILCKRMKMKKSQIHRCGSCVCSNIHDEKWLLLFTHREGVFWSLEDGLYPLREKEASVIVQWQHSVSNFIAYLTHSETRQSTAIVEALWDCTSAQTHVNTDRMTKYNRVQFNSTTLQQSWIYRLLYGTFSSTSLCNAM